MSHERILEEMAETAEALATRARDLQKKLASANAEIATLKKRDTAMYETLGDRETVPCFERALVMACLEHAIDDIAVKKKAIGSTKDLDSLIAFIESKENEKLVNLNRIFTGCEKQHFHQLASCLSRFKSLGNSYAHKGHPIGSSYRAVTRLLEAVQNDGNLQEYTDFHQFLEFITQNVENIIRVKRGIDMLDDIQERECKRVCKTRFGHVRVTGIPKATGVGGNLPIDIDTMEDTLLSDFSSMFAEEVVGVQLELLPNGQPKGAALVAFLNSDAADKVAERGSLTLPSFPNCTVQVKKWSFVGHKRPAMPLSRDGRWGESKYTKKELDQKKKPKKKS